MRPHLQVLVPSKRRTRLRRFWSAPSPFQFRPKWNRGSSDGAVASGGRPHEREVNAAMTVAVPPQPPPARDASAALINHANGRSLPRRWIYGGVATMVVAIAAATWAIWPSSTSPPHSATRYVSNLPRTPTPLAAPLIERAGAASNVRDPIDLYPEAAARAYTVACGISRVEIAAWRAVGGVDALNRHCTNLAQWSTVEPENREAIFAGIFGGVRLLALDA